MNQQQRNYVIKRVREILITKEKELRKSLTKNAIRITKRARLTLLQNDKVKIKSDSALSKLNDWDLDYVSCVFDFSEFEQPKKFDDEKYKKKSLVIKKEANRIIDQLMVGDAKEALVLIKSFEDFEI